MKDTSDKISISIPPENDDLNLSLLQKMFGVKNNVYKIVVQFHGEINILKLLAESVTNTFVEFYPDFQEVYNSDGSRSHTQITVFLPTDNIVAKSNLITWRVTYSRKVSSAG